MEKSRRFRGFEVETCARVARPKKQENRASLRRRVLGNPLKNLKKNCCQIISHERVVKSFEVETCARVVRPKKQKKSRQTTSSNSSKSIEELEKKNLFREMREQRLLIEAKKSCQPTLTEFFEIHRRTRKTRFVHEAKPLV